MADEIRLHVTGKRFLPLGERAHGHILLYRGNGPPTYALVVDGGAGGTQHPIAGRRTGGQHARPDRRVEREMAVPFQRRHEQRQERLEPFSANSVRWLPQHDERLTHSFIVDRKTRTPAQAAGDWPHLEQPKRACGGSR
jgi:hypothetical protein